MSGEALEDMVTTMEGQVAALAATDSVDPELPSIILSLRGCPREQIRWAPFFRSQRF